VMIHQPLGGVKGQAEDILIEAREIERCRRELFSIVAEHSGQPLDKVFIDGDRNYWMTADEALSYGMIDKILRKEK
ncbi:MAG: ATP-dependent Clp protease proteolytic subunit, partial [Bacteroidales bacterium]|nr:ATP-dependent Clp protease proteolytic subunit [Bacteroidales bacterium]